MNDTDSIMDLYGWMTLLAVCATLLFMIGVGIYHTYMHFRFKKELAILQRKLDEAKAKYGY